MTDRSHPSPCSRHLARSMHVAIAVVISSALSLKGHGGTPKADATPAKGLVNGNGAAVSSSPPDSSWEVIRFSQHGSYLLPVWSPDGQKLAFVSVQEDGRIGVWTTDREGTAPVLAAEYDGASEPHLRLVPAALQWLKEPGELMLALLVFEESALRSYSPPVVTQQLELVSPVPGTPGTAGPEGATAGVPIRVLHRYTPGHTGVRPPDPKEICAYRIVTPGERRTELVAMADTTRLRAVQGWNAVSHSAATLDRKGVALCFCADDDGPDDGHAGTVLVLRKDGQVWVGSKPFRWLDNLPDGRLVGGRIDGIWTLDDRGEPETRLVATDRPRRLDHFRMSPDGRRILWAEYVFPQGLTWWIAESGTNRVLTIRTRAGAPLQVANVEFLTPDRLLVHGACADHPEVRVWITTPDGQNTEPWSEPALPHGVSWMDVSPWHNAMLVLGRRSPDRLSESRGWAIRLQNGAPVLDSAGNVPLTGLPILNVNRKRALTPLVVWAPGTPAYAQTTEVKGRLIGADRPPRNELVIVRARD